MGVLSDVNAYLGSHTGRPPGRFGRLMHVHMAVRRWNPGAVRRNIALILFTPLITALYFHALFTHQIPLAIATGLVGSFCTGYLVRQFTSAFRAEPRTGPGKQTRPKGG